MVTNSKRLTRPLTTERSSEPQRINKEQTSGRFNVELQYKSSRQQQRERERDVGIICVKIYDDLSLEAWTQSEPEKRERERKREGRRKIP